MKTTLFQNTILKFWFKITYGAAPPGYCWPIIPLSIPERGWNGPGGTFKGPKSDINGFIEFSPEWSWEKVQNTINLSNSKEIIGKIYDHVTLEKSKIQNWWSAKKHKKTTTTTKKTKNTWMLNKKSSWLNSKYCLMKKDWVFL